MEQNNDYEVIKDLSLQESLDDIDVICDATSSFDCTIGIIEDILIDESFQNLLRSFLDQYWDQFDDCEENKLSYMEIFQLYVRLIEQIIDRKLKEALPDFDMEKFYDELRCNQDHLDGEVFEMLYTLSDFSAFKEMILDYKAVKEGRAVDFSKDICITSLSRVEVPHHI